jgi:hypothetical protein
MFFSLVILNEGFGARFPETFVAGRFFQFTREPELFQQYLIFNSPGLITGRCSFDQNEYLPGLGYGPGGCRQLPFCALTSWTLTSWP